MRGANTGGRAPLAFEVTGSTGAAAAAEDVEFTDEEDWDDEDLNDAWADLNELIETRKMMLAASWELHKFFYDCKEVRLIRLYLTGNRFSSVS